MDRLREFSIVTVSLPDSARASEFKAYVVGVHRTVATLQPVEHVEGTWLPSSIANVMMTFGHGAATVSLKGELKLGDRPDELSFRVSDGVCVPRRRSSRLKLCAPAAITVDGAEIACQTHDVGSDGVMLEGVPELRPQQAVALSMILPEDPEPVLAVALVTDVHDGGLCSLLFTGMEPDARRRLSEFVAEHFRRRLDIVRSLRVKSNDARQ